MAKKLGYITKRRKEKCNTQIDLVIGLVQLQDEDNIKRKKLKMKLSKSNFLIPNLMSKQLKQNKQIILIAALAPNTAETRTHKIQLMKSLSKRNRMIIKIKMT